MMRNYKFFIKSKNVNQILTGRDRKQSSEAKRKLEFNRQLISSSYTGQRRTEELKRSL